MKAIWQAIYWLKGFRFEGKEKECVHGVLLKPSIQKIEFFNINFAFKKIVNHKEKDRITFFNTIQSRAKRLSKMPLFSHSRANNIQTIILKDLLLRIQIDAPRKSRPFTLEYREERRPNISIRI